MDPSIWSEHISLTTASILLLYSSSTAISYGYAAAS